MKALFVSVLVYPFATIKVLNNNKVNDDNEFYIRRFYSIQVILRV